jgi:nicotinamidase-related amidase
MLIKASESCLLVVDIQEKLVPAIPDHQQLIGNAEWLLKIASILDIPVLASEQYPAGLGGTIPAIDKLLPPNSKIEKLHFSCAADLSCAQRIDEQKREQMVIIGMEAHVCVLQTALLLKQQGKQVFVVADTVSSRSAEDKTLALRRMENAGVVIVSKEMVAFEWMEQSGTDTFRQISKNFLR